VGFAAFAKKSYETAHFRLLLLACQPARQKYFAKCGMDSPACWEMF
jgi:hypothetical protein